MRKIYMVIADNGRSYEDHSWWNVRAFTSRTSAQEFIKTFTEEIKAARKRVDELGELMDERELTDLEREEYERVNDLDAEYWHFFDNGEFRITEYELYD